MQLIHHWALWKTMQREMVEHSEPQTEEGQLDRIGRRTDIQALLELGILLEQNSLAHQWQNRELHQEQVLLDFKKDCSNEKDHGH